MSATYTPNQTRGILKNATRNTQEPRMVQSVMPSQSNPPPRPNLNMGQSYVQPVNMNSVSRNQSNILPQNSYGNPNQRSMNNPSNQILNNVSSSMAMSRTVPVQNAQPSRIMNGSQIINQVGTSMGNQARGSNRQTVPIQN